MLSKFPLALGLQPRDYVLAKGLSDLVGLLPLHQAERDFCGGFRRDYRLRAFAGIAADDAIDVAGRTRGDLLDQEAIRLAGRDRKPDRFQERLRREIELL